MANPLSAFERALRYRGLDGDFSDEGGKLAEPSNPDDMDRISWRQGESLSGNTAIEQKNRAAEPLEYTPHAVRLPVSDPEKLLGDLFDIGRLEDF